MNDLTMSEQLFLEKLKVGVENARNARDINLDPRTIKRYASKLREKGYPICSHDCGYWIAESYEDAKISIARMEAAAYNTLESANALRNCFKEEFYE